MSDLKKIKRALLSVSDKEGLADFARGLAAQGVELLSTGGTAQALKDAGLTVTDVSDVTGFPEIMDGRVKTLHPKVHGGLLAVRDNAGHRDAMQTHGIAPIDLLVVNFYRFEATTDRAASYEECIENIDIGGPAMIRAAAKNHADVTTIIDTAEYKTVLDEMQTNGGATTLETRKRLAQKAFARTAAYDTAISNWMARTLKIDRPAHRTVGGHLIQPLRYGENPHQHAALYRTSGKRFGVVTAKQVQGKELSFNNINDTNAAYECLAEFDPKRTAACVIVKHANPCGVSEGENLAIAYHNALYCDPTSAFGGIVALNRKLDAETAQQIIKIFTEVIVAPDASDEAKAILAEKKNLRLLLAGGVPDPREPGLNVRSVSGGLLVQSRDNAVADDLDLKVVTKRQPTKAEMRDMVFAFRVAKHVKSNTIVYARDSATVGIGAGQMSRIDASRIAARKAVDSAREMKLDAPLTRGSVVASDAFFPFTDGLIAAIEAGATAVIQPGGGMRDDDIIKAADERDVAMVFTGVRHFKH